MGITWSTPRQRGHSRQSEQTSEATLCNPRCSTPKEDHDRYFTLKADYDSGIIVDIPTAGNNKYPVEYPAKLPAEPVEQVSGETQGELSVNQVENQVQVQVASHFSPWSTTACQSPSPSPSASLQGQTYSSTSTECWEHEPFETFQHHVMDLARSHIWPGIEEKDITLSHMSGGTYNRVVGIKRTFADGSDKEYVLRISRDGAQDPDFHHDIAAFRFIKERTKIPVPDVVAYDATTQNPLASPWILHNLLPGARPHHYLEIPPTLRFQLAEQLGLVYKDLLRQEHFEYGRIAPLGHIPHVFNSETNPDIGLHEFRLADFRTIPSSFEKNSSPEAHQGTDLRPLGMNRSTAFAFFINRLRAQRAKDYAAGDWMRCAFIDAFILIILEMQAEGYLNGVPISLCPWDMEPYNLLVRDGEYDDSQKPVLTGVLDWDGLFFGPAFLACKPPLWLWSSTTEISERRANWEPRTHWEQKAKMIFEEAAGPEFCKWAYHPAYQIARRLYHCIMFPPDVSEPQMAALDMMEEWVQFKWMSTGFKSSLSSPVTYINTRYLELRNGRCVPDDAEYMARLDALQRNC